jgi:carbon starvation protein
MVILLAVLALIVVKALATSPWGVFAIASTIPIAMAMGLYLRFVRPAGVLTASVVGLLLLLGAIWLGGQVAANPAIGGYFTLSGTTLAWCLMAYGFAASVLPVWLLLAPRDYLSSFLKIGTIAALAIGILLTLPAMHMPAVTRFIDGSGPVFAGSLFPFLFITIACGSVSGFHALVASGTTPKMLASEADLRIIGYGAMLAESAVAIMALIAACVLQPGAYFAMNSPAALVGTDVGQVAATISGWGFSIAPEALTSLAHQVGEASILGRSGGAPTLAVGMASIFSNILGGDRLMAFWYHFAILFEALFILTTIDAGTRVARFMLQDFAGMLVPSLARTTSLPANLLATTAAVAGWGYFLYQGVQDPLGGINSLWPLFGIANQMLAAIALTLCTVILFKSKRQRVAWVAMLPAAWLAICTLTAGTEKLFSASPAVGFLAHAARYQSRLAAGQLLTPAQSAAQMERIVLNDHVDAALTVLFMSVVLVMLACGLRAAWSALASPAITAREAARDLPLLQQNA